MPRDIDRDDVRRLRAEGAQLVEVLPASEYEEDHLPGAVNLPLRKLEAEGREFVVTDHHNHPRVTNRARSHRGEGPQGAALSLGGAIRVRQ